jgi:hypothetical protein
MDSDSGLMVAGQLLMGLSTAQKAYELMKANVVRGLSIGYDVIRSTGTPSGGRVLQEIKLWELSLVTFPMDQSATVFAVKSLDDVERVLRSVSDPTGPVIAHLRSIQEQLKTILAGQPDEAEDEELRLALKSLATNVKKYIA